MAPPKLPPSPMRDSETEPTETSSSVTPRTSTDVPTHTLIAAVTEL